MNGPVKAKDDDFFKSFTMITDFNNNAVPFTLGNLSFNFPNKALLSPKAKETIEEQKKGKSFLSDEESYFALNNQTGGVYALEKSTISKYYKKITG